MVIEGTGRAKADGKIALQALGVISFDDEAGVYRVCAFNNGRWLQTEIKLLDNSQRMTWGFELGEIKTASTLRINENGEWTEHADLTIGLKRLPVVMQPGRSGTRSLLEEIERKQILAALEQAKTVVASPNGAAAFLGLKRCNRGYRSWAFRRLASGPGGSSGDFHGKAAPSALT